MTCVALLEFSTDRGEDAIRHLSYAGRNALVMYMDLVGVLQAAGALRKARDGDIFVLLDPSVTSALLRALPADEVTLSDLDIRAHHCAFVELLPTEAGEPHGELWQHFWNTLNCSSTERAGRPRGEVMTTGDFYRDRLWLSAGVYTQCMLPDGESKELVIPLPAPPGIARRLVFFRGPGPPFGDAERNTAVLLQPHIAEALRMQGRRAAQQPLTGRQRELLALVAAGHDNIAIACQLGLSPATVRKHLENAFARATGRQPDSSSRQDMPRRHVALARGPYGTPQTAPRSPGGLVDGSPLTRPNALGVACLPRHAGGFLLCDATARAYAARLQRQPRRTSQAGCCGFVSGSGARPLYWQNMGFADGILTGAGPRCARPVSLFEGAGRGRPGTGGVILRPGIGARGKHMRILLISSAYNSMTQRVHVELADRGHCVSVELALSDEVMRDAVRRVDPDLVIAPMLTTAIPADIWSARPCFIVHPGPRGDRGPSSLDWAIMSGSGRWGVTVLQANAEMDAGDIWSTVEFPVPRYSKSSLYRTEVADAALDALLLAVTRFERGSYRPEPLDYSRPGVTGRLRPLCRQEDRRIDWAAEPTSSVVAKLRAADSRPGVLDVIGGAEYFLFGGHEEDHLRGDPGTILARRGGAICRATVDGAVWIPQLRSRPAPGGPATFKVPATLALGGSAAGLPESAAPLAVPPGRRTYQEISYHESAGVGYLEFSFPGGAMSTGECRRLLAAYRHAQRRPVRVIVLGGPRDVFSNGINLNVIEAADDPAAESWRNINAINDLVEAILTTTSQLTVAALAGNAAAGGLMLALAADEVWCRAGAVLNPHYQLMGLHGSEYWTYTLPRRVGAEQAARLTGECLPVSPASALRCGLVDQVIGGGAATYRAQVATLAGKLARSPDYPRRLAAKAQQLAAAAITQPLEAYRRAELAMMSRNFSGPGEPYARLRHAFVYKHKPTRTPPHLSRRRSGPSPSQPGRSREQETVASLDRSPGPPGNATAGRIECAASNR